MTVARLHGGEEGANRRLFAGRQSASHLLADDPITIDDVPCRTNRISDRIRRISGRRRIVAPTSLCGVGPDGAVPVAVREVRVSGIPDLGGWKPAPRRSAVPGRPWSECGRRAGISAGAGIGPRWE